MTAYYLYLHSPAVVFKARVNLASPTYPITTIPFDGVTVGAFGSIRVDQALWLGTTDGGSDLGRIRVQNLASSSAIPVGRISQGTNDGELTLIDNAYITVVDAFEVWSKIPYIQDDGTQLKDGNIGVGTFTTTPPPVANCGIGFAGTIDSGTSKITASFNAVNSFAVADGATITTYAWDVGDGTITVGSSSTSSITATFPAGFRWVALTVTDSNSKTHIARCPVFARDPNADVTIQKFDVELEITPSGQTLRANISENIPQSSFADGCLVLFVEGEPASASDRAQMKFIGWEASNDSDIRSSKTGFIRHADLHAVDVAGRLSNLPGFSQVIEATSTPANWSEMTAPNMDKYIHYLLLWHSTALSLADYFPSGTGTDYPFVTFNSDGENLYDQVNDQAKRLLPDHIFTCNTLGQLQVVNDPQLQDTAARTTLSWGEFDEDFTEQIQFTYKRPPSQHFVRGHAMLTQTDYTSVDGVDTLLTVHCIAPGTAPGQGVSEIETTEGLVPSQTVLNAVTGHRYARVNSRFGPITITSPDDTLFIDLEPANMQWVGVSLPAAYAAQRGIALSVRCLVSRITRRYEAQRTGTLRKSQFELEVETVGTPALTVTPVGTTAIPVDPIGPPDMGLISGQDLVAGIGKFKVYRTSDFTTPSGSGGPTWDAVDLTGADEILTWVVDPFSPGYIDGAGSIDGWVATATKLYRVEDLFGTPSTTAQVTFANTASWRTVQASFGTYFFEGLNPWLICVSYYGSLGGHTGTWATYSVDGGATWADEVQVSAFYDSGGAVNPIGLYCSPKTPGLAYTAAHVATANPATSGGFITTDWGATWSLMTASADPAKPLPLWGYMDYDGTYSDIGFQPSGSVDAFADGGVPGSTNVTRRLILAPPADTKRIVVSGVVDGLATRTGFGSAAGGLSYFKDGTVTRTVVSSSSSGGGYNVPYHATFVFEYTFGGYLANDWPHNSDIIEATPPSTGSPVGIYFNDNMIASGSGVNETTNYLALTATVTEIELDDGTVYVPTDPGVIAPIHGQAGEIHLPWEDNDSENIFLYGSISRSANRLIDLKQADAGTVTVIGPTVSAIQYGVNHGHFAVRCHDADRTLVLLAGTGNDTTSSTANDKQGLWFSSNGGSSWTQRIAPTTSTEPYSAAFSGSLDGVVYIWGPANYMGYSADNAATIDSRAGNLSALSATHIIGICGGPTP